MGFKFLAGTMACSLLIMWSLSSYLSTYDPNQNEPGYCQEYTNLLNAQARGNMPQVKYMINTDVAEKTCNCTFAEYKPYVNEYNETVPLLYSGAYACGRVANVSG